MTLGELIAALRRHDPGRKVANGIGEPHSYRGYYDQLAFSRVGATTVEMMLNAALAAVGARYYGYKGGQYIMFEHTDVWVASYGSLGKELTPAMLANILDSPREGPQELLNIYNAIMLSAENHGEHIGGPDGEASDLRTALFVALEIMSEEQRMRLINNGHVLANIKYHFPHQVCTECGQPLDVVTTNVPSPQLACNECGGMFDIYLTHTRAIS